MKIKTSFCIGLILFLAFILRIIFLSADPININFLATTDEGLYSYASRSMALFEQWQTDNFNYGRIMPIFPPLQLIGVKLLGIHSYSFRLISVFFSMLTILVLFLILNKNIGVKSALLVSLLLSFNFMYLVFSRSGLPEATMIFFALISFLFWFHSLTGKKNDLFYSLGSGIFFILAFFTKQSMISLFNVYSISVFILFFKDKVKLKKIIFGFFLPVALFLLFYYFYFYRSNPQEWYENYLATINIHRFRRVYFSLPYLVNQSKDFIFSDYWKFAGLLITSCIFFIALIRKKIPFIKNKINSFWLLFHLSFLWFLSVMPHMFFTPGKFGRFYVISLIPLFIIISYLIKILKGKLKNIFLTILFLDLLINIFYINKYIINGRKYLYLSAAKEINKLINNNDLVSLPPHWIMNTGHKTLNQFLISADNKSISLFYNKYGWPKYISIVEYQIVDYKNKASKFFSKLYFVKKINDYFIFKINK